VARHRKAGSVDVVVSRNPEGLRVVRRLANEVWENLQRQEGKIGILRGAVVFIDNAYANELTFLVLWAGDETIWVEEFDDPFNYPFNLSKPPSVTNLLSRHPPLLDCSHLSLNDEYLVAYSASAVPLKGRTGILVIHRNGTITDRVFAMS